MGEHETSGIFESLVEKLPGNFDIYFWNFVILMIFTVFEVAAVFFDTIPLSAVWAILIGVGIVKGYGIAAYFMHLKGDPRVYTRTALFPVLFVLLMLWGIGLSNPGAVGDLPAWCTPFSDGYATRR
ncbi:MAG: cytochrome C oxidase subunit IV family protein [archaeon]|jgi:caa(3)-type oxidase subunit IV|nr:cytochrome C oxidase subunit IV family protein [archaeon]